MMRPNRGEDLLREIAVSFGNGIDGAFRPRIVSVYAFLIGLSVAIWILALALFWTSPAVLGLCFLAYGCGLRHAFDADHIAAIDNVTQTHARRLAACGSRFTSVIQR